VVLAAGSWSSSLDGVPVRPVKGQILRLRFDPSDPPLTRNVRGFAGGRSVYLVPRADGELVVGATMEELGYDTRVTVEAVLDLLRAATDLVPAVRDLELHETHAGLRPGTPDNAPIIGVSPRDDRVVHATGHYRNGILLTPVTADAVASIVAGDGAPPVVAPFGVERFAS
jgi:glycine oxidase